MKGHDSPSAVLEGLAATNNPVDDHEDIVRRVSFADDGAVAPIPDWAATHRKNGAFRQSLSIVEDKCSWNAGPRAGYRLQGRPLSTCGLGRFYKLNFAHRAPPRSKPAVLVLLRGVKRLGPSNKVGKWTLAQPRDAICHTGLGLKAPTPGRVSPQMLIYINALISRPRPIR